MAGKKPYCRECKKREGNIILKFEQHGEKIFDYNDYKGQNGYCYDCFEQRFGIELNENEQFTY